MLTHIITSISLWLDYQYKYKDRYQIFVFPVLIAFTFLRVLKTIIESNTGYVPIVPGCGKEAVVTLKIFELNCEDVGRVVR